MRSDRRRRAIPARLLLHLAAIAALARPAGADDYDYLLLALTWTPSWCLETGDASDDQCDPRRELGFTLHGLWPQDEDGSWPEYCETPHPDPTRRQTAAMADVMGSGGLAWYQWKKHGRCTGVPAEAYLAAARRAYEEVSLPVIETTTVTAAAVEEAFLAANTDIGPDGIVVTCRDGMVREVRICLERGLAPRPCGAGVERSACRQRGPLDLPPVR